MRRSAHWLLFSAFLCGSAYSAGAQAPVAPPPPSPSGATRSDEPGVNYLTAKYGISRREAVNRLKLEQEVGELAQTLRDRDPETFGGIFIDHEPVFRIVLLFTDAETRTLAREQISPTLRQHVQIRRAARSERAVRQLTDSLLDTLQRAGVRSLVRFDHRNQKFIVVVANSSDRAKATDAIPSDVAPDVIVRVGNLPRDAQTGYVSGDYTYGGWAMYAAANDPRCTSGFVVRQSDGTWGVTTAGHCSLVNPSIYVTNHYVTLNPATVHQNSTYYDFKVHPTGRLTVYGYIFYVNNITIRGTNIVNYVSGYPNSGYIPIEDGLYTINHGMGVTMCKSGQRTGLSCGQIVSDYASYTTVDGVQRKGLIALGNSQQRVIGWAGDSGGPVFTPPVNGVIRPAGLVSGANAPSGTSPCDTAVYGGACELYYMRIDRINDAQPMQVKTQSGTWNP